MKLHKKGDEYFIEEGGTIYASTNNHPFINRYQIESLLHIINVDVLADMESERVFPGDDNKPAKARYQVGFESGYKTCLEHNSEKKYTLADMTNCWMSARMSEYHNHGIIFHQYIESVIDTWDVIIEMESVFQDDSMVIDDEGLTMKATVNKAGFVNVIAIK